MHILLVEPDKMLAKDYVAALEGNGHSVSHATTAQGGIHAADTRTPDAIVLELHLKKHNGMEFIYELRSYSDWQHIPVVIVSFVQPDAFGQDEAILMQFGICEYLYKPTASLADIVRAVNRSPAAARS